jgi:hypothetical protein
VAGRSRSRTTHSLKDIMLIINNIDTATSFAVALSKTRLASNGFQTRVSPLVATCQPMQLPHMYLEEMIDLKPDGEVEVLKKDGDELEKIKAETLVLITARCVVSQASHRLSQLLRLIDLSKVQPDDNPKRRELLAELQASPGAKAGWQAVGFTMTDKTGRVAVNRGLSDELLWDNFLQGGNLQWMTYALTMTATICHLSESWGQTDDGEGQMMHVLPTYMARQVYDKLSFLMHVTPMNNNLLKALNVLKGKI